MEDEKIIALFWSRSEQAIEEIAAKYGRLGRKLQEIFWKMSRTRRNALTIPIWAYGTAYLPLGPLCCVPMYAG